MLKCPHKIFPFFFHLRRLLRRFAVKWATLQCLRNTFPYCPLALPSSAKRGRMTPANFPHFFAPLSCGASSSLSMLRQSDIDWIASRSISSFLCRYFRVVLMDECPKMPWTMFSGTFSSTSRVAVSQQELRTLEAFWTIR